MLQQAGSVADAVAATMARLRAEHMRGEHAEHKRWQCTLCSR